DGARRLLAAQGSVIAGQEFWRADQTGQADLGMAGPPQPGIGAPGFLIDPVANVLHSDAHFFFRFPVGQSAGALSKGLILSSLSPSSLVTSVILAVFGSTSTRTMSRPAILAA